MCARLHRTCEGLFEHVNFMSIFCENSRYGLAFLTELDFFCLVCETVMTLSPCIIRSLLHERILKF